MTGRGERGSRKEKGKRKKEKGERKKEKRRSEGLGLAVGYLVFQSITERLDAVNVSLF